MALASHDASADDRSRAGTGARADHEAHRRRPLLHVVGGAAAVDLDRRLLALSGRAARCRLIEGLVATPLLARRGWTALGFVRLADYARERLGLGARSVEESVRVATALEDLPRTAAAVLDGTLSWTATRLVTGIATPRDEAGWIEKARSVDARALQVLVRQARAPARTSDDPTPTSSAGEADNVEHEDPRVRWSVRVSPLGRRMWRAAHELGERTAGSKLTLARVLELVAAEASGSAPRAVGDNPSEDVDRNAAIRDLLDQLRSAGAGRAVGAEPDADSASDNASDSASDSANDSANDNAATDPSPNAPPSFASILSEIAAREGFPWLVPPVPTDATAPSAWLERQRHAFESADPFVIDERLREVRRREQRTDFDLASLLREAARRRLYRDFGFANLETYVESRLGICARTAWTLLAIERMASRTSPRLSEAWRDGRINTMAAHAILHVLGHGHDEEWIARARAVMLRRLEAEVDWARARLAEGGTGEPPPEGLDLAGARLTGVTTEELRMRATTASSSAPATTDELQKRARAAQSTQATASSDSPATEAAVSTFVPSEPITFFAPQSVCTLADETMRALRTGSEPRGRAFERMLALALLEWMAVPRHRDPVFERDGWLCSVPGCTSRRNLHDHHIVFRSRGGDNAHDNRITVCAAHHLHGLHRGRIRAHGHAPGEVAWEIGIRFGPGNDGKPLFRTVGDRHVDPLPGG